MEEEERLLASEELDRNHAPLLLDGGVVLGKHGCEEADGEEEVDVVLRVGDSPANSLSPVSSRGATPEEVSGLTVEVPLPPSYRPVAGLGAGVNQVVRGVAGMGERGATTLPTPGQCRVTIMSAPAGGKVMEETLEPMEVVEEGGPSHNSGPVCSEGEAEEEEGGTGGGPTVSLDSPGCSDACPNHLITTPSRMP